MSEDDSPRPGAAKPLVDEILATCETKRAVPVHPATVKALDGDIALAALIQQLIYRESADRNVERWTAPSGRVYVDATRAEIAEDLGVSEDQARRLIEKARERGVIETIQPYKATHNRRLFVRFCRIEGAILPPVPGAESPSRADLGSSEEAPGGVEGPESAPLPLEGFRDLPIEENTSRDDFETWWLGYPKRGGTTRGPKKPARAAWDRLSAADRAAAVRATPNYTEATDQKFVCDAVRFLTQRRFDEWLEPGRPRGSSWAGPRGRGPEHPLTMEEREAW
jgi:hypothetical protein